ncbi:MAG TPA: DUF6263 family protein [Lacibacter sp.]|nr:DUF6263 family protein [Lacibacter sp.]HMO87887.1 DUF6263 family protein [Lacibacter sp.]HMP86379.1 DUF6263 family protein [Lacibacter sp.]
MKRTFFTLLLPLVTTLAFAQTLQPWKLNFPAGQAYNVTNTIESKLDQQVMGQQMNITNSTVTQAALSFRPAGAEGFRVEQSTTTLKLDMQMMGQSTTFDSNNPDDMNGPIGERLRDMIGTTLEAVISTDGKITVIKGTTMPEGFSMGTGTNDSTMLAGYFVKSPGKPVQPGGSWSESAETGGTKMQVTYTYRKTENGQAHLDYEMTNSVVETMTTNGMEIQTNIQTKGKGTLLLELATGLVLERRYEGTLTGKSEVMGMEIPQEGIQKMTNILTKK